MEELAHGSSPVPGDGGENTVFTRRMYVFFSCIVLFGLTVAPYSGVHLPRLVMFAIGAVGILILILFTVTRTDYLVLLMVSYIPFSKILVGDFGGMLKGMNAFNILFILLLISWLMHGTRRRGHFHTSLDALLLIFVLFAAISLTRGGLRGGHNFLETLITDIKRWMSPVMLYFLIVNVIDEKQLRKDTIILIMFTVFVVGLLGLKEFYLDKRGGGTWEKVRIEGIADQANQLGAFFVYYMPFLVSFIFMNLRNPRYWKLALPLLVCVRALMLTVSRAAFLSFSMGWYVLVYLRNKFLFFALLFGSALIVMNPQILPEVVTGRFEGIVDERRVGIDDEFNPEQLEGSARLRVYALEAGLQMIRDYPLLGVGYNMFPYEVGRYSLVLDRGFDTHNSYLTIATEMGIPALVLFIIILAVIFFNTIYVFKNSGDRFIKTAALGWSMGMIGVFISNLFGSRLEALELSGYFWMVSAIFMRESTEIKNVKRKENRFTLRDDSEENDS